METAKKKKPRRQFRGPGVRRGGKTFSKRQDKSEEAKKKWLHHCLKTLHKHLKKAREFEVRKVARRLANARKAFSEKDVTKLESQLEQVKQFDIDELARQAALKHGLTAEPTSTSTAADVVEAIRDTTAQALQTRLLQAGCVRKPLEEMVTEFKRRFSGQPDATAQPGADSAAAGKASLAPEGNDQAASGSSEEGGDDESAPEGSPAGEAPVADEDLDDTARGALAKLLAGNEVVPQARAAGGNGDVEDEDRRAGAGSSSDADSGCMDLEDLGDLSDLSDLGLGEEGSGSSSDEEDGEDGEDSDEPAAARAGGAASSRQGASGGKQGQARSKPGKAGDKEEADGVGKKRKGSKLGDPLKKKPKNRLGQNARRRLAAQTYGANAKHLQAKRMQGQAPEGSRPWGPGGPGAGSKRGDGNPGKASLEPGRSQHQHQQQGAPSQQQPAAAAALHPSWQARQQQKQQLQIKIASAAPKKIVFDNDGDGVAVSGKAAKGAHAAHQGTAPAPGNGKQGKPFGRGAGVPDSGPDRRHSGKPAGAAGAAAAVQGSKGKAAAGGGGGGATGLHPSWEARRLQREKAADIMAPKGTKVVFDD